MRAPRFRLRSLLLAVVITGINFGVIAGSGRAERGSGFIAALLLTWPVSLLIVAVLRIGIRLARHGRAGSFTTGYFLVGGFVSFIVCLAIATESYWLLGMEFNVQGYNPLTPPDPPSSSIFGESVFLLGVTALYALAQIIPGLIGGAIAARCGVEITRGSADASNGILATVPEPEA